MLEHIPDLEGVIAEVGRLLKPGRRFYFTVPSPGFQENLRGSMVPGVSRERYLASLDRRLAHYHYLSARDWQAIATRHDLRIDSVTGYLDRRETRRWENLSRVTRGLLQSISFGTRRPIEIQRALRIRDLQNRVALPNAAAAAIAKLISTGDDSDTEGTPSCLMVIGSRPGD